MSKIKLKKLDRLRSFEVAARLGGFAAAAVEMNVTSAAVSQQIRSIEKEFGVALFLRLPNGIVLTSEGQTLLSRIVYALRVIDEAVGNVCSGELAGILTINVAPSFAMHWLMPRIGDFIQRYPQIAITVCADEHPGKNVSNQFDLRIVHGSGDYKHLDARMLLKDEVFPVLSPDLYYRLPVSTFFDLADHVLLHDARVSVSETSMRWQRWFDDEKLAISTKQRHLQFGSAALMLNAALRGYGVALGRSALVDDYLASGRLIAPLPKRKMAEHAYYSLTTSSMALSPRVIAFRSWLHGQVHLIQERVPL